MLESSYLPHPGRTPSSCKALPPCSSASSQTHTSQHHFWIVTRGSLYCMHEQRINTLTATWSCYLLSKWIDNAFPKNTAYLFPTFVSCPFQEHGIKNVTQCKQSKHGCIQVGRILVALNPSTIPQVLHHLVVLNCLVSSLFQWVPNKGCRTQKMNLYYSWNQTLENLKRMAW